jgi:hypothetical protein
LIINNALGWIKFTNQLLIIRIWINRNLFLRHAILYILAKSLFISRAHHSFDCFTWHHHWMCDSALSWPESVNLLWKLGCHHGAIFLLNFELTLIILRLPIDMVHKHLTVPSMMNRAYILFYICNYYLVICYLKVCVIFTIHFYNRSSSVLIWMGATPSFFFQFFFWKVLL